MAVDENRVRFCTELAGLKSVFLPFDQGHDGGAGNPPNPQGLRTDYLWQETLTPESLTDIIENYAQKVGKKHIWPRYHQLESVRQLLRDVSTKGAGERYLIQHSAGSGKSNSIAWLARQLIGLQTGAQTIFDSTIIVTEGKCQSCTSSWFLRGTSKRSARMMPFIQIRWVNSKLATM